MSSIALGMYDDVTNALISDDKSNLKSLSNRDIEVNRQYFLLVRLIRSTLVDRRLANTFNLENIDILDYRVAANILENAGDIIVELSTLIYNSSLPKDYSTKMYAKLPKTHPVMSHGCCSCEPEKLDHENWSTNHS